MKKLLLVISIMLSGCAVVDAYLMTHYDPNEYKLVTDIRAEAQIYKSQCDDFATSKTNAIKLANNTNLFVLYSEHIPHNDQLISASQDLHAIAKGLVDQYSESDKVSTGFCKIKFASIESNADIIQKTIAGRPR